MENVKKNIIDQNKHRTTHVPSDAPEKPTSHPNAKNEAQAVVAAKPGKERISKIVERGENVLCSIRMAEAALEKLGESMTAYGEIVSDKSSPTVTDRKIGAVDMDVASGMKDVASTAVALLLQSLQGRKARSLALAANDLLVLGELARDCWAAFVRGTAASVLLLDAD